MLSPLVLESRDVLNISTNFVSSSIAPASQHSTSSTEVETEIVQDSLEAALNAQRSQAADMTKSNRTKVQSEDLYDISSSPARLSSKKKHVNDEPIPSSLPQMKSKKPHGANRKQHATQGKSSRDVASRVQASPSSNDDDEEQSEEHSVESDEYQPSQPKPKTLGSKLAAAGKLRSAPTSMKTGDKNVAKAAPTRPTKEDKSIKQPNKESLLNASKKGKADTREAKEVINETQQPGATKKHVGQTAERIVRDAAQPLRSRKDGMQNSSKVLNKELPTMSGTVKSRKADKKTIDVAATDPVRKKLMVTDQSTSRSGQIGQSFHSSPPLKATLAEKAPAKLVGDDDLGNISVIGFGKDGRLYQGRTSEQYSKNQHTKAKMPALTPKKRLRHIEQVTERNSNVANDNENALAGFGLEPSSDRPSKKARYEAQPAKPAAKTQPNTTVQPEGEPDDSGYQSTIKNPPNTTKRSATTDAHTTERPAKKISLNGSPISEVLEWRSTLRAHQQGLFDQLVGDAESLVRYLVQREEIIQDLVDEYRQRGQDLVEEMELSHAREYQKYCMERDRESTSK